MSQFMQKINSYSKNSFHEHSDHYQSLANGQQPHSLLITCSDSRLCPNEFTETTGGEVFIIRNAGNLVPTYNSENPSNEGLTLEYGVCALGIKEVIVCGHKSCGAMGGLMDTSKLDSLPSVQRGLENYKAKHIEDVTSINDLDKMIAWNVKTQLLSIATYPFIKDLLKKGELTVQGLVYDFTKGSAVEVASLDTSAQLSN